jgi:hypothetical protein
MRTHHTGRQAAVGRWRGRPVSCLRRSSDLGLGMQNSTYFVCRAAHYRQLAATALNDKIASSYLALANTFLQLAGDLRRIESTAARSAEVAANKAA